MPDNLHQLDLEICILCTVLQFEWRIVFRRSGREGRRLTMDWNAVRQEFPVTQNYNYQNNAAVAPMCRRAVSASERFLQEALEHSCVRGVAYKEADRVRERSAELLNADQDEICFVKNTSEGLSFVANGLDWREGDNVVTSNVEFPANVYPWLALESKKVRIKTVNEEDGRIPLEKLFAAIDSRTRLVAISSIQFASGFRTDLVELGEYCRQKGVLLCVDAIQSLGAFPIDVEAMKIDFLSADAHKWLCGPEGLGIFYVRRERQDLLKPSCIGWMGVKDPMDFDNIQLEFRDSAKRYDTGAYNLMGIYALGGALDTLMEIGIDTISSRLLELTDMLVSGIQDKGYKVFSSRAKGEASGIVSFSSSQHDSCRIRDSLQAEHNLIVSVRGGRLRASPHVYASADDIQQLIDLLPAQ